MEGRGDYGSSCFGEQLVHMEVGRLGFLFNFSAIYAKCTRVGRRELWGMMAMVHAQFSSPLMVAGDFNVIFKVDERSGGASPNPRNMEEFNEAIFQCNLSEVSFDGSLFTWTNREVWQRLDGALVNVDWSSLFICTKVSPLLRGRSDHALLLVKCGNSRNRGSSFHFLDRMRVV